MRAFLRKMENELPWQDFSSRYHQLYNKYREEHPDTDKFNPDCEECEGKGIRISTYNPDSQWDWYRIGGRWDGYISDAPNLVIEGNEGGFNFDACYETVERNNIKASELLDFYLRNEDNTSRVPFAMVTIDGEWIQKGSMGWFGMSHDDKPEATWRDCVKEQLMANPESYVVACDLHI
jgi:hypothetical protein